MIVGILIGMSISAYIAVTALTYIAMKKAVLREPWDGHWLMTVFVSVIWPISVLLVGVSVVVFDYPTRGFCRTEDA